MDAYVAAGWANLFVATLGGTAALTGLIFVGVSINLARIMSLPGVAERGLEAIVLLVTPLVASLLGLVPQPPVALGVELLATSLASLAVLATLQTVQWRLVERRYRSSLLARMSLAGGATAAAAIAGLTLMLHAGGGLYWMVPALLLSILTAVASAWVLLVEIAR